MCRSCLDYFVVGVVLAGVFMTLLVNTTVQQVWRPERDSGGNFLRYEALAEQWRLDPSFVFVTVIKYAVSFALFGASLHAIKKGVDLHKSRQKKRK